MICQWCFEEEAMEGCDVCKNCYNALYENDIPESLDELFEGLIDKEVDNT